MAKPHKYEWAEIDVRRTADGHHILLHDETLDRTTRGSGPVACRTLDYIRQLGSGMTDAVPTLSDALHLSSGKLGLYLDCRGVDPVGLVRDIEVADMLERVMVCIEPSLHPVLRQAGGRAIPLVAFYDGSPEAEAVNATVRDPGPRVLEVPCDRISPALVESARHTGARLGCLAMGSHDNAEGWRRAMMLGVDWIMTDFPEQLRRHVDSFGA